VSVCCEVWGEACGSVRSRGVVLISIAGEVKEPIVALQDMLSTWGAKRFKRDFDLSCSERAIARVLRQHSLLKKRRRKH
jgi:hypothetical protein